MNYLMVQYSYLQVLDFLTTLAFLAHGIQEANPLVRGLIGITESSFGGVLLAKLIAIGLGMYCWKMGRVNLLVRINFLFAVLIAWNIIAIAVGATQGVHA
jgi:hypothetical protein